MGGRLGLRAALNIGRAPCDLSRAADGRMAPEWRGIAACFSARRERLAGGADAATGPGDRAARDAVRKRRPLVGPLPQLSLLRAVQRAAAAASRSSTGCSARPSARRARCTARAGAFRSCAMRSSSRSWRSWFRSMRLRRPSVRVLMLPSMLSSWSAMARSWRGDAVVGRHQQVAVGEQLLHLAQVRQRRCRAWSRRARSAVASARRSPRPPGA